MNAIKINRAELVRIVAALEESGNSDLSIKLRKSYSCKLSQGSEEVTAASLKQMFLSALLATLMFGGGAKADSKIKEMSDSVRDPKQVEQAADKYTQLDKKTQLKAMLLDAVTTNLISMDDAKDLLEKFGGRDADFAYKAISLTLEKFSALGYAGTAIKRYKQFMSDVEEYMEVDKAKLKSFFTKKYDSVAWEKYFALAHFKSDLSLPERRKAEFAFYNLPKTKRWLEDLHRRIKTINMKLDALVK